ncbi:hypothetical protein [Bradyrhizobium quebecense]|uniref:Uncharacterized protein n=2 Tax=Bradyrhizobium quebecense TaxID=2748629 RepID=A0ACD3VB19_9BRAD|nr:hypothetical protein [Bradyrhizobium quebecense]UGY03559.1 hypothetical protein J4P68_0001910 [Bradyrhizobium quebecense]
MRAISLGFAVATAIALFTFGQSVFAAPIGAVVKACDRTAGCNYTLNKAGDLSGCSSKVCFYCPNNSKRQCFPVQ